MEFFTDEYFMQKALAEAQKALDEDEIPIGAVVVYENKIIGKGYNQTEKLNDVTAHAEMLAITAAATYLNSKFLVLPVHFLPKKHLWPNKAISSQGN